MQKLEKLGIWGRSFLLLSILCLVAVYARAQPVADTAEGQDYSPTVCASVKVIETGAVTVADSKVCCSRCIRELVS